MEKDIREDIAWAKINGDVLKSLENPRKLYWVIIFLALAAFGVGVGCEIYQYNVGMGVAASVTALLLYGQAVATGRRAYAILGGTYLFVAMVMFLSCLLPVVEE